jgi:hypothetical protein
MGYAAELDTKRPLSKESVDRNNWGRFIDFVKEHYNDDLQVEIKPNYINLRAGEHRKLPFEGHKFLSFSSKISGARTEASGIEQYIDFVTHAAQWHSGSRVQYWNELFDCYSACDWPKVSKSIESYEEVRDACIMSLLGEQNFDILLAGRRGRASEQHRRNASWH